MHTVDGVIRKMRRVTRLRLLLLTIEQLPVNEAKKPRHLEDWTQSENEECINFIEAGKIPDGVIGVDGLATHLAAHNFKVNFCEDDFDNCRYDDPMQEYYDQGYGSD